MQDHNNDEENVGYSSNKKVYATFKEEEYESEFFEIGRYLNTQTTNPSWTRKQFNEFRKKAHQFFLHDGHLWRCPKKPTENPLRVICKKDTKEKLLSEFHDSVWAGHRGIWATFAKLREKYWWSSMY